MDIQNNSTKAAAKEPNLGISTIFNIRLKPPAKILINETTFVFLKKIKF